MARKWKLSRTSFQQDGVTCHTATETMLLLEKMFHNRMILKNTQILWPSRSPDLSVCDFFLWGYLKSRVYENKPKDLEEITNEIRRHTEAIPKAMLTKVYESFVQRLQNCIENEGKHLSNIIFKTSKLCK